MSIHEIPEVRKGNSVVVDAAVTGTVSEIKKVTDRDDTD